MSTSAMPMMQSQGFAALTDNTFYDDIDTDVYDTYADAFDPLHSDRQARRKRKPTKKHQPKKSQQQLLTELADQTDLENTFQTTYRPAQHEAVWLAESLRPFYVEQKITDVLALVKGGKEASVYRCEAHPSTGYTRLAAKVYRPRMFRNLRNDAQYREGRDVLTAEGRAVRIRDKRTRRALEKGSAYGESVAHTSWLMYEFQALSKLYAAGLPVPEPLAVGSNAVLMGYVGSEDLPASTLNHVHLEDPDEAHALYETVVDSIDRMLGLGVIHGDLSAYNILYWQGSITLIDFPQVTDPQHNRSAREVFGRDVQRVCEYFSGQGVETDAESLAAAIWARHMAPDDPESTAADMSRFDVDEDDT